MLNLLVSRLLIVVVCSLPRHRVCVPDQPVAGFCVLVMSDIDLILMGIISTFVIIGIIINF